VCVLEGYQGESGRNYLNLGQIMCIVTMGVAKSHREVTFYYFHNTYYTTLLTYPREIKIVKIPPRTTSRDRFSRRDSHPSVDAPQKSARSAPSVGGAPRRLDARCVVEGRGLFMDKEVVKEHFDGRQGRQLRTSHQSSPANHGCRESSSLGRPLDAALSRTSVRFWRGRAFGERTSREFSANTLVAQPLSRARHRARRLMRVS